MTSRLDQWLAVLGSDEYDLTADEIYEMCYLAVIQHRFGVESPQQPQESTSPVAPKPPGITERSSGQLPEPSAPTPVDPPQRPSRSAGGLFNRNISATPESEAKPLRVPTAPALRDPLPLARALRPLMQQWAIGQGSKLDESATVQKIAEERVWWPVTKPQTETWLELALVVDESPSMLIWRRTIEELERFFKHYGFFRDVRMWGLIARQVPVRRGTRSGDQASPTQPSGAKTEAQTKTQICLRATPFARLNTQDLRQPDSLIDPTGRRVVLIVSDCVDSIWQEPELLSTFKLWSSSSPMAILQMMPEWLWPRTNLRQGTVVNFKGKTRGSANHALDVVLADAAYYRKSRTEKQTDIKVPVMTLEADRVESWAQMLTAHGPYQAAGVILNPKAQQMTVAAQRRRQQKAADTASAAYKAQAFRGYSSPVSRRLASLLAASPAITLPIIRVVQETLVPQSEQVHVAEVLLGGILRPQQEPALGTNPDDVPYEFIDPDIRAELLAEAPVKDTTEVLSHYIEENFPWSHSLPEFILELRRLMRTETTEADNLKPIATIAAEVLQYRGMEYADFVQEVKERYEPSSAPRGDEQTSPIFPEFEPFDFIDAKFIDEADSENEPSFHPPLQPIEFTIITVELQPNSSAQISENDAHRLLEQKISEIKQLIIQNFEEQEIDLRLNMHPRDISSENIDESEISISTEQEIDIEFLETEFLGIEEKSIAFRIATKIRFSVNIGYFDFDRYIPAIQESPPHTYATWPDQSVNGKAHVYLQVLEDDLEEELTDAEVDSVDLELDTPILLRQTTELISSVPESTSDLELIEFVVATIRRDDNAMFEDGRWDDSAEWGDNAVWNDQVSWVIHRQQQRAYRFIEPLPEDITLEMVAIPAGTFLMGSPEDEPERYDDESPQHEVTIESFFMGRYPITQAQWKVVAAVPQVERELDPDPSSFKGDNRPVEKVSWLDATEFCARLSAYTGREYRLPSEAEWEYACRAGTITPFHFGETISSELACYQGGIAYANGPEGENRQETTPVDHFEVANAFGLYDMHGNVVEWCQDHWHSNYEGAPTDGSAWLTEDDGANRVFRGGSWVSYPRDCRSAYRNYLEPGDVYYCYGFRVVCAAPRTL
jgi:formylglycine-generating enzyme required for sulfatase activity